MPTSTDDHTHRYAHLSRQKASAVQTVRTFLRCTACALIVLLSLNACDQRSSDRQPTSTASEQNSLTVDPALAAVTGALWDIGSNSLTDSVAAANELQQQIDIFLNQSDAEHLAQARRAWHAAHNAYLNFEPFTFLGRTSPELFGDLSRSNFAIHAWPITPGYVDYFHVYTSSGIVNDIAMPITAQAVREQHGFSDDSDVSIGLHTIAYLLWGETGQRPLSDFEEQQTLTAAQRDSGMRVVDLPNNRRRALLKLLAQLLVDDLNQLNSVWKDQLNGPQRNYSALSPASRVPLWQGVGVELIAALQQRYPLISEKAVTAKEVVAVEAKAGNSAEPSGAQADIDAFANEAENDTSVFDDVRHNQYAGQAHRALSYSLESLSKLLLEQDSVGPWIFSPEQQLSLRESLASLLHTLRGPEPALETETATDVEPIDEAVLSNQVHTTLNQILAALSDETSTDSETPPADDTVLSRAHGDTGGSTTQ